MQRSGALYTILFSLGVCAVCSFMVSVAAVSLKSIQDRNDLLDKQRKVLTVAGLMEEGQRLPADEIFDRFANNIVPKFVNLETGEYATPDEVGIAYDVYDQRKAAASNELGRPAPDNRARVRRVPKYALVYHKLDDAGAIDRIILPIEGYGLWGTLYGFIALEGDANTIAGITFYEHKETPGLGGEVDNPNWKAAWEGRKSFGPEGQVQIRVRKGPAEGPGEAPFEVDGLSGATITANGVTNLLQLWLGPDGFRPYLERHQQGGVA